MYSAFNTLQLELERLVLLRESIDLANMEDNDTDSYNKLVNKINEHTHAIQIVVREHQAEQRHASSSQTG